MENINNFLAGMTKLNVPKADQFQTIDLYEKKNPTQVLDSIIAFARHAQKQNADIPLLGPKLADKHQTSFSQEQLDAGKHMPTQQSVYCFIYYFGLSHIIIISN
jgi:transgelin